MARYIDANLLLDKIGAVPLWHGYVEPYPFEVHLALVEIEKQLKETIKAVPTADVVEVVYCKDCEHWERCEPEFMTYRPYKKESTRGYCEMLWMGYNSERSYTHECHYCGHGRKKEEKL